MEKKRGSGDHGFNQRDCRGFETSCRSGVPVARGLDLSTSAQTDFFVSYNQHDRGWAEWVAWQLETAGYVTLIQAQDFGPGSNFVIAMHTGLEASDLAPLEVDVAPLQRHDLPDSQSTFTAQQRRSLANLLRDAVAVTAAVTLGDTAVTLIIAACEQPRTQAVAENSTGAVAGQRRWIVADDGEGNHRKPSGTKHSE